MKKLLYILSLMVLAMACTNDPFEQSGAGAQTATSQGEPKVMIDFSVQVNDPSVATRALAHTPKLRNLMVAVFDPSGYLLEYTYATEIDLATENTTRYNYKVAVTQSDERRIIHFIGNAPDKLTFGVEEAVLASITSSVGDNEDDGIYWCRREIPQISGTNSGGAMALADDDDDPMAINSPIYQADAQTRAYFDNVGLIRNFAQIELVASSEHFTLEKFYVVGTPKTGLAAAYNYNSGAFVNYFKSGTVSGDEDSGYTFDLGSPKDYADIIGEGYDANVLPSAEKFTLAEADANWIAAGTSAYVYECEKPLKAEDAVYIIAYGTYSDGEQYYYKIDLRNADGYFPILRNFKYTIDIKEVTRAGYKTIEKAATSAGSGDISTSLETKSLAYISDGVASLEVEYIEKYIVTPGDVTLDYTFLDDVSTSHAGAASKMWIVVNEAGTTGAAIAKINGNDYTVGTKINVTKNPGTITITPTATADVPKSQTLTIFAEYVNGEASHILQRTVNFIVQSKRTMLVSLAPSEVPKTSGSEFDVKISLPAGLSKSIFPLEFLIESEALSINPCNDQMPVRTGVTLKDGSSKSSFYFVKSLAYADYNPESGAANIVNCHFKTIKAEAATHIYAANPYFETAYDYEGTVSNEDNAASKSVYLDVYDAERFTMLQFSEYPTVGVGEDLPIRVDFSMSSVPEDHIVYVALGNLQPAESEQQLTYVGLENGKAVYEFVAMSTSGVLNLTTAHPVGDLSVDLSAYHFIPASSSVSREKYKFNGDFNKPILLGLAEAVKYTFYVPYYYEDMVIEVEMKGLKFNENKLPADWDNWRDLGNGVYGVRYTPSGFLNSVTIDLLPTIVDTDEVCSITLQAQGYEKWTSTISARKFDFTSSWSRTTLTGQYRTTDFTFNIPEDGFTYDMKVYVTFNNGLTFSGSLPAGWVADTSKANTYIYTPTQSGDVTVTLTPSSTTNVADGTTYSVTVKSSYFNDHTSSSIAWRNVIVIPQGNLITNIARNNGFASGGTIYLYTNSNYTGTAVGYRYGRSTYNNNYSNGKATNSSDIELTGVTANSTIYIQYTNGSRTYRGSFTLSDALDNNGATVTLSQQ